MIVIINYYYSNGKLITCKTNQLNVIIQIHPQPHELCPLEYTGKAMQIIINI